MVTYFNRKDLRSFGKYLLSDKRKASIQETIDTLKKESSIENPDDPNHEDTFGDVHQADIENWLERRMQAQFKWELLNTAIDEHGKFQQKILEELQDDPSKYADASIYTVLLDLCKGSSPHEVFTVLREVTKDLLPPGQNIQAPE